MDSVKGMVLKDYKLKNKMMLIIYSISLLVGMSLAFVRADIQLGLYYFSQMIVLIAAFIIVSYIVNKIELFPYFYTLIVATYTISFTLFFGGGFSVIFIAFFYLLFSSFHYRYSVYGIGLIMGLIMMVVEFNLGEAQQEPFVSLQPFVLLIYLLFSLVLFGMIRINQKQFTSMQEMFKNEEKKSIEETGQKMFLFNGLTDITENVVQTKGKLQTNLESQTEMATAINQIAAGSQTQSEQVVDISMNAQTTLSMMKHLNEQSVSLKNKRVQLPIKLAKDRSL
ncbi:hypothetical protein [Bacillus sp. JCM 19034]|uniref:hypothetical protein n=1 Tax=Bacillus sp. JCM 19034 TaxID=1481928 RepID=UPI000784F119|nr:hypothetical protein [Bacillus sp. JCM 19034]